MNGKQDGTRFHGWLASRAARSAPSGLLARSMAALDQAPARRWIWPLARSTAFAPTVATVAALALVVVLVVGFLPHRPPPVAEGLPTATSTVTASPTEAVTASPSATASTSGTPEATVTPRPTPAVTPVPTPADTPPPSGPLGTLTFRLILNSLPPDTDYIAISIASNRDRTGPYPTLIPPLQGLNSNYFVLCGGETNPAPCVAPMTYEQTFSGFEPVYLNYYAFFVSKRTPGVAADWFKSGQRAADGGVVEVTYPASVPAGCQGFDAYASGQLEPGQEYRPENGACLSDVTWNFGDSPPTSGIGTLTLDGVPFYTADFAKWDLIGTDGAGSGERLVIFDPAIRIGIGQSLGLLVSNCPQCVERHLHVDYNARVP